MPIRYQLGTMHLASPEAMVHFKQFVTLMESGTIPVDMLIRVEFIGKSGWKQIAKEQELPANIMPLFWSHDNEGFSILHGVNCQSGRPWDSEGHSQREVN